MHFEDISEMMQKAEATVTAAAEVVWFSLLKTSFQEDILSRQLALKYEAQRLTDAFEEQQRQICRLQRKYRASESEKVLCGQDEMQEKKTSSSPPPSTAIFCIGSFKLIRHQNTVASEKAFISMQQLQHEVQQRMCDCFSNLAGTIRSAQVVFEAKRQKILVGKTEHPHYIHARGSLAPMLQKSKDPRI